MGLALASDAKAVVIQDENGKSDVKTEFDTVSGAISYLADPDEDTAALEYVGEIVAVLNSNGTAAWVVFDSETELLTGTNRPSDDKEDDTNKMCIRDRCKEAFVKNSWPMGYTSGLMISGGA